MALFKPVSGLPKQTVDLEEDACEADADESGSEELGLGVEVPIYVQMPRKRIGRVRFHVKNRVRLAPNPILPEIIE